MNTVKITGHFTRCAQTLSELTRGLQQLEIALVANLGEGEGMVMKKTATALVTISALKKSCEMDL